MPDTEEVKKTVDIDTSGPAMDVDVPEEKDVAEVEQPEVKEENPSVRPVTEDNEREVKLDDQKEPKEELEQYSDCLLYTSPSPRDVEESRMPSSA